MTQVKQVIEVSIPEMIDYIKNHVETMKTPPFVNITMETPFTGWVMKCKTDGTINPYWKEVTKEVTKTYLLVTNYKKRVTTNMGKEGIEGEHDLKELSGKRHVEGLKSILIDTETESKYYIMVEQFMEVKPSKTIYRHNGNEIEKTLFEKWMKTYDSYTNQLNDRKVEVISPLLSNIKRISVNGIEFILKH